MPGDDIQVGDIVLVPYVLAPLRARVIEDRGRIGYRGRRLLRIEVLDEEVGDEPWRFEVPAEDVSRAA